MGREDRERDKFTVVVRIRPLSKNEKQLGATEIVSTLGANVAVLTEPPTSDDDYLRLNRRREKKFAFDHVFDENCPQETVFANSAEKLIDDVLDGYNSTVFAYGPTGAGKTFTMLGTPDQPGVMVLTLRTLFERLQDDKDLQSKVTISYLEVYNENIRDLLAPGPEHLDLREDPLKGIAVAGIKEFLVSSAHEVMQLLQKGNKNRTTEPTKANETSSRSHAVCQVHVERKEKTANVDANIIIGKLSLIDLAGSERASSTENRGIRLVEGANINRSLLALANCINALGDKRKKGAFVPYRDSKLTRLLKDSLGGNCRTVMIANISPSSYVFEETLNTLKYANRAKNIKVKAAKSVKNVSYHISEYQRIISDLRSEIFDLKHQLANKSTKEISAGKVVEMASGPYDSVRESKTFQEIHKQLVDNFAERIQLKKSIIELEDTNFANKMEVERIEKILNTTPKEDSNGEETLKLAAEATTYKENIQENLQYKAQIEKSIKELEDEYQSLRGDIQDKITRKERRDLLILLIQSQSLEIQNMELELQLQIRDKMIQDQYRVLKEHGLEKEINFEQYEVLLQTLAKENEISPLQTSELEVELNLNLTDSSEDIIEVIKTERKPKSPVKDIKPIILMSPNIPGMVPKSNRGGSRGSVTLPPLSKASPLVSPISSPGKHSVASVRSLPSVKSEDWNRPHKLDHLKKKKKKKETQKLKQLQGIYMNKQKSSPWK